MSKQKNKLQNLSNGYSSNWMQKADYFIENKGWLQYSSRVAMRILTAIEETPGMNQKKLAEAVGVKDQYISKVIKGQQNLSLKSIFKLSEALGVELISFPDFVYSQPVKPKSAKIVPFNYIPSESTNKTFEIASFAL